MSKSKELAKNTVIMMIGKIFTQFLSFFLLPVYTRYLPTEEYGAADLILTYITLLTPVITVQQEMATFRYLVDARKDEKRKAKIITTSLESTLLRLLVFAMPVFVASFFISSSYISIVLLAGIFASLSHLFLQIARGLGDNEKYTFGSVIAGVITLASNLILICLLRFGGESILISMALGNLGCALYLFLTLKIPAYLKAASSDDKLKKSMLKYSWPLVPNGISWWLINASDRTIVSAFLGVAANGIYAVATKIPSIISGFLGIFTLSWTESASLHINDPDRDEFFSSVARNIVKIFSSLSILVIAVMPFVFDIIIGADYRKAYNYIPIAILGVFFNCMVSVYSAIYVAKKLTKKVAMTSFLSAVINIVADLGLIHFIGLYAAVISTAIAFLVMTIYRHFDVKKYVRIKYKPTDLILAILGFSVITFLYYLSGSIAHVLALLLAFVLSIFLNRALFDSLFHKIAPTLKRDS